MVGREDEVSYFFGRLQGGDETEDGQETRTGGGKCSSSTLERRSGRGLGRSASAGGSRGLNGNGAVGRRVRRSGNGLVNGLDGCFDRSSRGLGGLGDNNSGGAAAVVADRDDGRSGGLDDGATSRAVGDCEGRGLGNGVGLAGVGDLGGLGAVCRVCGDNFGHVSRSSAVLGVLVGALGSRDTSHSGDSEGGSETHGGISREVVGLLVRLSIK